MFPARPKVRHSCRRNAPRHAPCPRCGVPGHRKDTFARTVRGIASGAIFLWHVTTGEYRATCGCCTTLCTQIDGIEPKASAPGSEDSTRGYIPREGIAVGACRGERLGM